MTKAALYRRRGELLRQKIYGNECISLSIRDEPKVLMKMRLMHRDDVDDRGIESQAELLTRDEGNVSNLTNDVDVAIGEGYIQESVHRYRSMMTNV